MARRLASTTTNDKPLTHIPHRIKPRSLVLGQARAKSPTEHQEQAALFRWADLMTRKLPALGNLFAIPNGGARQVVTGARLKAEGVRRGIPDVELAYPVTPYHGLFIELKRRNGGSVSAYQREWIKTLRGAGYRVEVCKGWEEAKRTILDYLRITA